MALNKSEQMRDGPDATILVAAHNRLPLLKESLASALQQDHGNYEILVVDDGSDRETRQWLQETCDAHPSLRVEFQEHSGVAVARAVGVQQARGDRICILDSDDLLAPNALSRLTSELDEHPQAGIVYSYIRELQPQGKSVVQRYPNFDSAQAMLWAAFVSPRVPFKHTGTTFYRARALELGSYDRSLPCKIDIDFYFKFLVNDHCPRLIEEPLVSFRMHRDSISKNRWLGLRVWFGLIDRYGPGNPLKRLFAKLVRTAAETFKFVYIKTVG